MEYSEVNRQQLENIESEDNVRWSKLCPLPKKENAILEYNNGIATPSNEVRVNIEISSMQFK